MKNQILRPLTSFIFAILLLGFLPNAHTWTVIAEARGSASLSQIVKKTMTVQNFTTVSGAVIANLKFGYETYGTLNSDGSNAVLVAHHFTGTSHAAGRYEGESSQAAAGEWDAIIGPGKAIDTNQYFVVSADTIANMNVKDSRVVTTGPTTVDTATGKPYGTNFPTVTIRDFVNAQHALAQHLGIKSFRLVIGASMGSMQAMEWAVAYPEMVEKVAAVIPAGLASSPHLIATLDTWMNPVRTNGSEGLHAAFQLIALSTQNLSWTKSFQKDHLATWTVADQSPLANPQNGFRIQVAIQDFARSRAEALEAASFLATARAAQLYRVGQSPNLVDDLRKIRARILLLPGRSDLLLFPAYAEEAHRVLKSLGKKSSIRYIEGDGGHADGITKTDQLDLHLRHFMKASTKEANGKLGH